MIIMKKCFFLFKRIFPQLSINYRLLFYSIMLTSCLSALITSASPLLMAIITDKLSGGYLTGEPRPWAYFSLPLIYILFIIMSKGTLFLSLSLQSSLRIGFVNTIAKMYLSALYQGHFSELMTHCDYLIHLMSPPADFASRAVKP